LSAITNKVDESYAVGRPKISKKDIGTGIAPYIMWGNALEGSYSKGGKSMYAKSLGFAIAITLAILLLPSSSYAQSRTATESVADIDTSTHPNGSIVILNKEQTDVPGYVHTQNAFIDQLCGAQLLDPLRPAGRSQRQRAKTS
jgi:hypothetical protein